MKERAVGLVRPSQTLLGMTGMVLAIFLALMMALPAAAAQDSKCVVQCKVECKRQEAECKVKVAATCSMHPTLGRICQTAFLRNCGMTRTYCEKVGCGLMTDCPDDKPKPRPRGGRSTGEPHIYTFDDVAYDFQAVGEFVLAQTLDRSVVVQVRQVAFNDGVSFNGAVAARVGADRVALYHMQPDAVSGAVFVNGAATTLAEGAETELPSGGRVVRTGASDYEIRYPEALGTIVRVSIGRFMDVELIPGPGQAGQFEGLLGDFNGDTTNDLRARAGDVLGGAATGQVPSVRREDLYGVFGKSWRISQEESLFDYGPGETTATFTDESFPRQALTLSGLDPEAREKARIACEAAGIAPGKVMDDCILDVAVTGDETLVSSFQGIGEMSAVAVSAPLQLEGWRQEGEISHGNWQVSEDGRSVIQKFNGEPTFFVGPEIHSNVTIRGRMTVETQIDDDLIGFVMGYRAPESGNGEADFVLLDWKQSYQESDGHAVEEGFRLSRVKGPMDDIVQTFWGAVESDTVKRLASHSGLKTGWRDLTEHLFELRYGERRLQIFIDGQKIFDVEGEFPPGRFGFYNYSQSDVRYHGFEIQQGVRFD